MKKSTVALTIALGVLFYHPMLNGYYLPVQFYAPKMFLAEPRIQKDWLSSLDVTISEGATTHSLNNIGQRVPLLDIYGNHSINPMLHTIEPCSAHLPIINATASLCARFRFNQTLFCAIQNYINGFFVSLFLPIRYLSIIWPQFIDCTDISQTNTALAKELGGFFNHYGLHKNKTSSVGVGDMVALIGRTWSLFSNPYLDFIDISAQMGLLLATSKQRNEDRILSLPLGFDGHWGCLGAGDISFGAFEWVTLGMHVDLIAFIPHNGDMYIKTNMSESGIIFLSKRSVRRFRLPQISSGIYIKADHFARGFSFTMAYTFTYQGKTHLSLVGSHENHSSSSLLSHDTRFAHWYSSVMHCSLEYDFTSRTDIVGPRIGIFYDTPISGKNIFLTPALTGQVGIDITWNF